MVMAKQVHSGGSGTFIESFQKRLSCVQSFGMLALSIDMEAMFITHFHSLHIICKRIVATPHVRVTCVT